MTERQGDWRIVGVLPNLKFGRDPTGRPFSVEAASIVLVGSSDPRYQAAARAEPGMETFLASFRDEFGGKLEPAAILHRSKRGLPAFEAVVSFRDLIVAAAVPLEQARLIAHDGAGLPGPAYSEGFDIYPWMPRQDGKSLVLQTPALLSWARPDGFRGQSAPGVPIVPFWQAHVDTPLLEVLIAEWNAEWRRRKHPSRNTWHARLFRSLQMASRASRMPAVADTSEYDLGRSIALWISAFEILVHPGSGKVSIRNVLALLDRIEWREPALRRRRLRGPGAKQREAVPTWIYRHLYDARNAFLHGNPLGRQHTYFRNGQPIARFAAPLYRMAVACLLDPGPGDAPPDSAGEVAISDRIAEAMIFYDYQDTFEEALLKAIGKPTQTMDG